MGGGGGGVTPSNSGICFPTVIKLGMIILCGKNFSNLAKQFMTSSPMFKYDVISDFTVSRQPKMSVISTHICRIKGCGGAGWPPHQ